MYIGEIGQRITANVTLVNEYQFTTHFAYQTKTNYIYTMVDDQGNVLVWKTSSFLYIEGTNEAGEYWSYAPHKGDCFEIKATVKAHGEYKGQQQTELQRVKVLAIISKAPTKEEIDAKKKAEQLASLGENDIVWHMPYKQYKEHYSDCETVAGSFESTRWGKTIGVIIREGRLKASGVRGEHYSGYQCTNEKGEIVVYRAVSEDNALRRAAKEFPESTWECTHIYHYHQY